LIGELVIANLSFISSVYIFSLFSIIFHLAGMNHLFYQWQPLYFKQRMRWLFASGVVIGAIGGCFGFFSERVIGLTTAFMGGAILINVVYYEMPREGEKKTLPFFVGISAFVLIISFIRYVIQS
jgi:hypothetical protein